MVRLAGEFLSGESVDFCITLLRYRRENSGRSPDTQSCVCTHKQSLPRKRSSQTGIRFLDREMLPARVFRADFISVQNRQFSQLLPAKQKGGRPTVSGRVTAASSWQHRTMPFVNGVRDFLCRKKKRRKNEIVTAFVRLPTHSGGHRHSLLSGVTITAGDITELTTDGPNFEWAVDGGGQKKK